MRSLSFYFLILICIGHTALSCQVINQDAQDIYREHLDNVENYISLLESNREFKIDSKNLNTSCTFLENLTNIKAETLRTYDNLLVPSKDNYISWKEWFQKNQKLLYIENDTVKVKQF